MDAAPGVHRARRLLSGPERRPWTALETKSKGWWHAYGSVVPAWFELYVSMEAAASRLRQYQVSLVPGLLQTREYATALFRSRPRLTEQEVEDAVAVRVARQQLLIRRMPPAPLLDVIIEEAVLRRPIGDPSGHRGQLDHLASLARHPSIRVRLIPLSTGLHPVLHSGGFVILDFPSVNGRVQEPTTVYSDDMTGALYLDKPGEVQTYTDAWEILDARALDRKQSSEFILKVIKEIGDA